MKNLNVTININDDIYLKDPTTTELGKKILFNSIILIDKLGIEDFNFKKLAQRISSTESSIYRYFENKHYLFIYLINWYWNWMSIRIEIALQNLTDPNEKIKRIIKALIENSFINMDVPFIDEEVLHRIIVREGTKAYHHKTVDTDNDYGFFLAYKALCKKISLVFLEVNPNYPYPKTLASTLLEVCNSNIYFAKHLPRLTDLQFNNDLEGMSNDLFDMLYTMTQANLTYDHKQNSE